MSVRLSRAGSSPFVLFYPPLISRGDSHRTTGRAASDATAAALVELALNSWHNIVAVGLGQFVVPSPELGRPGRDCDAGRPVGADG